MTNLNFPLVGVVLMYLLLDYATATAALVESQVYLAGEHYSEWQFSGSKAKCALKHEVPEFGISEFVRLAGEELKFHIASFQPIPKSVEGLLREVSPSWKHEKPDPLTNPLHLHMGQIPVNLQRQEAAWLLSSLAKGQMPSFDFLDWDDTRKKVQVRLSPVNYQKPYRKFKRCLKQISDKGYQNYRDFEISFDLDVHVLSELARTRLNELSAFVIADQSIKQVRIEGHADDQGTNHYNEKLSMRRAVTVENYLVKSGVNPAYISRTAYGETKPKIKSRSNHARAANRRAKIQLFR